MGDVRTTCVDPDGSAGEVRGQVATERNGKSGVDSVRVGG